VKHEILQRSSMLLVPQQQQYAAGECTGTPPCLVSKYFVKKQ
jgi:hypothetical protein